MLPLYSFNFLLIVAFAIFYYRAAVFENASTILWTTLSVAISFLMWQWLKWGFLGIILGQLGLFFGISVFRVIRKE